MILDPFTVKTGQKNMKRCSSGVLVCQIIHCPHYVTFPRSGLITTSREWLLCLLWYLCIRTPKWPGNSGMYSLERFSMCLLVERIPFVTCIFRSTEFRAAGIESRNFPDYCEWCTFALPYHCIFMFLRNVVYFWLEVYIVLWTITSHSKIL
jgi:hypothetical protein